jgi:hypothetical protein
MLSHCRLFYDDANGSTKKGINIHAERNQVPGFNKTQPPVCCIIDQIFLHCSLDLRCVEGCRAGIFQPIIT